MLVITKLDNSIEKLNPFLVKRVAEDVGHPFHGNQWTEGGQGAKAEEAAKIFQSVGLQVSGAASLPQQALDQLKFKEAHVSGDILIAAQGVAQSVNDIKQIPMLHDSVVKTLQVVTGAYEPKGASMTMVTGKTPQGFKAVMLLNTEGEPRKGLLAGAEHQYAYSAIKIEKMMREGKLTVEQGIKESYRISALHEYGHLFDRLTDDLGRSTFLTTISQKVGTDGHKIVEWLTKNVSPYAATGLADAFAEAFSIKMSGGTLPKELEPWWSKLMKDTRGSR